MDFWSATLVSGPEAASASFCVRAYSWFIISTRLVLCSGLSTGICARPRCRAKLLICWNEFPRGKSRGVQFRGERTVAQIRNGTTSKVISTMGTRRQVSCVRQVNSQIPRQALKKEGVTRGLPGGGGGVGDGVFPSLMPSPFQKCFARTGSRCECPAP